MSENNAVTKDELKEILAEMRQEYRQELKEFRAETFARIDDSEKKTAARFEESERKAAARFDATDEKMEKMHRELLEMMRAQSETLQVHGEMLRVQGETLQVHGEMLRVQGETLQVHGEMLRVHGETLQRQGETLRKQGDMIMAQNQKIDDQYKYFNENHSRLLTGMDAEVKELAQFRLDHLSFSAIQNRHTTDIETIKTRLGISDNNGNGGKNDSSPEPVKPRPPQKKKPK